MYTPKWKRLEQTKSLEEQVVLPLATLKWSVLKTGDQVITKKCRQVSYVKKKKKNTDVLGEADV